MKLATLPRRGIALVLASLLVGVVGGGAIIGVPAANAAPGLNITKTPNATSVANAVGGVPVSWTINYTCLSTTEDCTGATLTDTVPAGMTPTGYPTGPNIAAVNLVGSTVTWTFVDPLPAGTTGSVTITATAPCSTSTQSFTNSATFAASNAGSKTATSAAVTVTGASTCTASFKKDGSRVAAPGSTGNFYFNFPKQAGPYTVTDPVPAGMKLSDPLGNDDIGTPSAYWPYDAQISCNGGTTWNPPDVTTGTCKNSLATHVRYNIPGPSDPRWNTGTTYAAATLWYDVDLSVAPGTIITNTATVTSGVGVGDTSAVPVHIGEPGFLPDMVKVLVRPTGGTYNNNLGAPPKPLGPTDAVYAVIMGQATTAAKDLVNPIITDLLDANMTYTDPANWWVITLAFGGPLPAGCFNPVFTATPNFNGGTKTQLKWDFQNCTLLKGLRGQTPSMILKYSATPKGGIAPGTEIKNVVSVQAADGGKPQFCGSASRPAGDDKSCIADAWFNFPTIANFDSSKWVQGAADSQSTWTRYPASGNTSIAANGAGTFRLFLNSTGNVDTSALDLVDILPHVGDTGVVAPGPRNSGWGQVLADAVTVEFVEAASVTGTAPYTALTGWQPLVEGTDYTIVYSQSYNPCRFDATDQLHVDATAGPAGCVNDWSATSANAKSFGIKLLKSLKYNRSGGPGDLVRISVPVKHNGVSAIAGDVDKIAWNSFGYTVTDTTAKEYLSSEPIQVGIKMTAAPAIDLALSKSLTSSASVTAGDTAADITFKLDVTNLGKATALAGFTVTDTLPAGLVFDATTPASGTGYTCTTAGQDLTCTSDHSLAPLAGAAPVDTITVKAHLAAGATGGTVRNLAYVSPAPTDILESNVLEIPTATTDTATSATNNDGHADLTITAPLPYSLGNRVWMDTNNDGLIGATEVAVDGVSVSLLDSTGTVVKTATTANGGYYRFDALTAGTYTVRIDASNFAAGAKLGFYQSSTTTETDPNLDVDSNDNGLQPASLSAYATDGVVSGPVTLGGATPEPTNDTDRDPTNPPGEATDGRSNLSVDFGFYRLTIGTIVWFDKNNDGVRQATESPVVGATVELLDEGGAVIGSATTDATGNYVIDHLSSGAPLSPATKYTVRIPGGQAVLAGYAPSTPNISGVNDQNNGTLSGGGAAVSQQFVLTTGVAGSAQAVDNATATTSNPTLDFGFRAVGSSLGDRVWVDTDENGQQDTGEVGVAGVKVSLVDSTGNPVNDLYGNPVASQTTDASGKYLFTNLAAGTYQVMFDTATLPANTELTSQFTGPSVSDSDANPATGKSGFVTLGGNENNPTIDAGIIPKRASIGNFVWFDLDGDGVQDAGETGVSGVTVNLLNASGTVLATQTTDAAGAYLFDKLKPNVAYTVEFAPGTIPQGYVFTVTNGTDPSTNSDASTLTGRAAPVTPAPGENILTVDAGIVPKAGASLGNYVWSDADADGQQDPTELGVPGVKVSLVDAVTGNSVTDQFGVSVAPQTTDAAGRYLFTKLNPGSYRVVFDPATLPAGSQFTTVDSGPDVTDSDANVTTGSSPAVTLADGEDNLTIDAGVRAIPASLGNLVWYDLDLDGQQDAGETGVAGVTVNLIDGAGAVVKSMPTDANGNYLFDNLPPGVPYTVEFDPATLPNGYQFTVADTGADATDSDANTATGRTGSYTLAPGEYNPTVDAGIHLIPASLGDRVWYDADNNGTQDAGEAAVPNVTVNLLDSAGAVLRTTTTNANGNYFFDKLTPGVAYTVEFVKSTLPPLYGFTTAGAGSSSTNSDADRVTGKTGTYILSPGETNLTVDAGIVKITASIGDRVWIDDNANGTQDAAEIGVANVQVLLLDASGATIATKTTDADGMYLFTDLPPNVAYTVSFDAATFPNGYNLTTANVGLDAGDSDADPLTGKTGAYTPGDAEQILTVDAGLVAKPASLGDYVWYDLDRDGQQGASEKPVPGVTVRLIGPSGTVVASAVTDAAGAYRFDNLKAGVAYMVLFDPSSLPTGYEFTNSNSGADATDSDAGADGKTGTYILAPGEHNPTVDAGIAPQVGAGLGDTVWFDTNRNGQHDAGELGVAGVKVTLTDTAGQPVKDVFGTPVGPQTTDAQGKYLFTKLAPGTYKVIFDPTTLPAKSAFTSKDTGADATDSDADLATGATGTYTLAKDELNLTVDAGVVSIPASLGDYVWFDDNSNGIQEAAEKPVSGVKVNLLDASGAAIASTTTDAAGAYRFDNLVPGVAYSVEFVASTLPAGYTFTTQGAGSDTSNSDAAVATGRTKSVTLAPGEHFPHLDAGIVRAPVVVTVPSVTVPAASNPTTTAPTTTVPAPTTTVAPVTTVAPRPTVPPSNRLNVLVFADANKDGKSGGDKGIAGSVVELIAPDGAVRQVTVSPDGRLSFDNIAPGRYQIRVVSQGDNGAATTKVLGEVLVPVSGEASIEFGFAPDKTVDAELAFTGGNAGTLALIGLAVILAGLAIVLSARRRESKARR